MRIFYLFCTFWFTIIVSATYNSNGIYKLLQRIIDQCNKKEDVIKCFKIHAIKVADKATKIKQLGIIDGVSLIKTNLPHARNLYISPKDVKQLENIQSNTLDYIFWTKIDEFLSTHKLQFKLTEDLEEGRGKKGRKYIWPLAIALGVKGVLMAMSYQGVAVMSGSALILGKIALILSAILGLKKLIASGQEKSTTVEIVKHPQHSHSHITSSSYEDDGHSYYHRAYDEENEHDPHDRLYRAYVNDTMR